MKKLHILTALAVALVMLVPSVSEARSGCCSWHGGVCGCGCCDGTSLSATCAPYYPECNAPTSVPQYVDPLPKPAPVIAQAPVYFTGVPRSRTDLLNCLVVGNKISKIYHLRGSRLIKSMTPKNKVCFRNEAAAKALNYRKSLVK